MSIALRTIAASSRRATSSSTRSGASRRSAGRLVVRAALGVHRRAAQRVDRAVVDDPEDPGAHRAARAVVVRAGAPQVQERLLDDVLGAPRACRPSGRRASRPRRSGARRSPRTRAHRPAPSAGSGLRRRVRARPSARSFAPAAPLGSAIGRQVVKDLAAPRARRRAACGPRGRARRGTAARRLWRLRWVRSTTRPTAAPAPTTTAAAGPIAARGQLRGSLIAASSHASSSSAASSTIEPSVVSSRALQVHRAARRRQRGAQAGLDVVERSRSRHRRPSPFMSACTISSSCRMARCSNTLVAPSVRSERARDLAVVHAEREAHDQRLAAVVGQLLDAAQDPREVVAVLHQALGRVRRARARPRRRCWSAAAASGRGSSSPRGCARCGSATAAAGGPGTPAGRARSAGRPAGTSARSGPRRRGGCPPGSTSTSRRPSGAPCRARRSRRRAWPCPGLWPCGTDTTSAYAALRLLAARLRARSARPSSARARRCPR